MLRDLLHSLRYTWVNLHPLIRFVTTALLIGVIAFFSWRPFKSGARSFRDHRDLKLAKEAISEGNFPEARDRSYQILRRNPGSTEVLPLLLHAQDRLGDPMRAQLALSFLDNTKDADPAQRLFAWEVSCRSASTWRLGAMWRKLEEREKSDLRYLEPWARRMISEDLNDMAISLLQALPEPRPAATERLLLDAMVAKADQASFIQAQVRIAGALEEQSASAAELLDATDGIPYGSLMPRLSQACRKWLDAGNKPDVADELRLIRLRMAAEPGDADSLFATGMGKFAGSEPFATGRWCLLVGKPADAVPLLSPLAAAGNMEAYGLLADHYRGTGDHDAWAGLIAGCPQGVDGGILYCDRAFIFSKKAQPREQAEQEQLSFEGATRRQIVDDSVVKLARRAHQSGLTNLARRLWIEIITRGMGPPPYSQQIEYVFAELEERREEESLFQMLSTYSFLEPYNPKILSKFLYLSCLRGQATPANAIADIGKMSEMLPGSGTLAQEPLILANLLSNNDGEVIFLTGGDNVDYAGMPPAQRVMRGIALTRTGEAERAKECLRGLPWETFLPSERRVFEQMLKVEK